MSSLSSLNALSSLSSLSESAPSNSNAGSASTTASSSTANTPSWLTGTLSKYTIIVLGLLFIAAGIFSFDKTKQVLVQAGKTAATA